MRMCTFCLLLLGTILDLVLIGRALEEVSDCVLKSQEAILSVDNTVMLLDMVSEMNVSWVLLLLGMRLMRNGRCPRRRNTVLKVVNRNLFSFTNTQMVQRTPAPAMDIIPIMIL